jgi:hypothetical protein
MKARSARIALAALLATAPLAAGVAPAQDPYADAPPYVRPVAPKTNVRPLITVGQQIPLTGGLLGESFRFVGIPDGMGLYQNGAGRLTLLVNHEFRRPAGGPAGPLSSGARVSELRLSFARRGLRSPLAVASGRYAIERVFEGDVPTEVTPGTKQLARLCSASLATGRVGFDRPNLLHGEESTGADTFDGRGGQAFATFEGTAYALPRLGRISWENAVPAPFTGSKTVIFGLEDGGTLDSEVYMYVGEKDPQATDALSINGLNNGRLYVFAGDDPADDSEATLTTKGRTVTGHWVEVDWRQTDAGLAEAAKAAGAFGFVRVEDGTADPKQPGVLYFDTTGTPGTVNPFGRLYRMNFNPGDPTGAAALTLLLDGSEGIVSPDNIEVNKHGEIAIQEDPNYNLSAQLGLARDSSIWIYDTFTQALTRIAEIDRDRARAHALAANPANTSSSSSDTPGGWETSGIIDAEEFLGRGAWLFDVQAHSLRIVPVSETVEGGQILLLQWKPGDEQ